MNEIKLKNWEEFEDETRKLYNKNKMLQSNSQLHHSDFLFRGQANSEWKLKTTLERYSKRNYSFESYNHLIARIKSSIESFTGKTWDFEDYSFDKKERPSPPNYQFMSYLRHFGFPSPLLDWTRSSYVAAYFAFNKVEKRIVISSVFIVIKEYCGEGKAYSGSSPRIENIGSYIKTDKRHFIQKSEYTICAIKKIMILNIVFMMKFLLMEKLTLNRIL